MAPGLGRKQAQGGLQFSRIGWGGQQGADDYEAQTRPTVSLTGVFDWFQVHSKLRYRRHRLWE